MYGYIQIDKSLLTENEFSLYHTFLCGLCISTKRLFGNIPRLTLSYDVNFFNVLFHSFCDITVVAENARCILSPVKKRSILETTGITDLVSAGSLLMLWAKLDDDVLDERSIAKRGIRRMLKPFFKRADEILPRFANELRMKYSLLERLEAEHCPLLDEVCDPFATVSALFARAVLKEKSNPTIESLCYNLGKWVYLIDALDDLREDIKAKRYNPLTACFYDNSYPLTADNFKKVNRQNLEFIFYAVLNAVARDFNDLNLTKYRCLLTNVIYTSIRKQTERLLEPQKGE